MVYATCVIMYNSVHVHVHVMYACVTIHVMCAGLSRTDLVALALLLGCDYCPEGTCVCVNATMCNVIMHAHTNVHVHVHVHFVHVYTHVAIDIIILHLSRLRE